MGVERCVALTFLKLALRGKEESVCDIYCWGFTILLRANLFPQGAEL